MGCALRQAQGERILEERCKMRNRIWVSLMMVVAIACSYGQEAYTISEVASFSFKILRGSDRLSDVTCVGAGNEGSSYYGPPSIVSDSRKFIYILDSINDRVLVFDSTGVSSKILDLRTKVRRVQSDMCVDADQNVYIFSASPPVTEYSEYLDIHGHHAGKFAFEIRKYDPSGKLVEVLLLPVAKEWMDSHVIPTTIIADFNGNLYVGDTGPARFVPLLPTGAVKTSVSLNVPIRVVAPGELLIGSPKLFMDKTVEKADSKLAFWGSSVHEGVEGILERKEVKRPKGVFVRNVFRNDDQTIFQVVNRERARPDREYCVYELGFYSKKNDELIIVSELSKNLLIGTKKMFCLNRDGTMCYFYLNETSAKLVEINPRWK